MPSDTQSAAFCRATMRQAYEKSANPCRSVRMAYLELLDFWRQRTLRPVRRERARVQMRRRSDSDHACRQCDTARQMAPPMSRGAGCLLEAPPMATPCPSSSRGAAFLRRYARKRRYYIYEAILFLLSSAFIMTLLRDERRGSICFACLREDEPLRQACAMRSARPHDPLELPMRPARRAPCPQKCLQTPAEDAPTQKEAPSQRHAPLRHDERATCALSLAAARFFFFHPPEI